jgi:predicted helicase
MPPPKSSPFSVLVDTYLKRIAHAAAAPGASPELSLRPALDDLLQKALELQKKHKHFHLSHEALSDSADDSGKKIGRPDFILFTEQPVKAPVGYCEAESIDADLRSLKGHALHQNTRYKQNLDNFLLTNHLSFELYVGGHRILHAKLPDPRELIAPDLAEINQLEHLLDRFFTASYESTLAPLKNPRDLAEALARRTRQLHFAVEQALTSGSKYLKSLKDAFERVLLPQLKDADFADLYAQTVAYGLFAARCAVQKNDHSKPRPFDRQHAVEYIPKSNPFLRELFDHVSSHKIEDAIRWITDDIARLLDAAPYVSIRPKSRTLTRREDPVIHFYETFLAAYNPKMREKRGVYYTPEPAVNYIVRSIDELLKTRLGRPQGLADPTVKILDPATGTGTFLAQTILHIYESFEKANNAGAFDSDYISKKLVPRLFGFELLVAPYTVAHLKLNLLLRDLCPDYDPDKRLEVYLTNALEPPKEEAELPLSEFISEENNHAANIKGQENILVVLGNPPYSGHSANQGKAIKDLLHGKAPIPATKDQKAAKFSEPDYFKCDGKPLGERNPKWLNDDYVKFIRFAQWRIDRTGEGILAFITNHGYLDNPTFRGMRQALMHSFSEIHVLDLHGNDRKKEVDPTTGEKDENIFDIQQGVAILLAIKKKDHTGPCQVFHADLYGKRAIQDSRKQNAPISGGKYHWLWEHDSTTTTWKKLTPDTPDYNFFAYASNQSSHWKSWTGTQSVFKLKSAGVVTARDHFCLAFSPTEITARIRKFLATEDEVARSTFDLGPDARDWKVRFAREDITNYPNWEDAIHPLNYRPFDTRYTCFTGNTRGFICMPRFEVTRHLIVGPNLSLIAARQAKDDWGTFISPSPIGHKACVGYDINSCFPLYLYPAEGETDFETHPQTGRRPNLSDAFLADLARSLKKKRVLKPDRAAELTQGNHVQYVGLPEGITPEEIFHYLYAILHSPEYRTRYAEFLKMDFPRLPLPGTPALFAALSTHGARLTALHLLDTNTAPDLDQIRHGFPVPGPSIVAPKFPKYIPITNTGTGRIHINETQYFDAVPETTWNHKIGGYQVAEKWLKDRRDRTLTSDDRTHYQRTLIALAETQKEMALIDSTIATHGGWPHAFTAPA